MLTNRLKPMPLISRFFDDNCEMWGTRVILALIQMPDRKVHCIALSHHIEPEQSKSVTPTGLDYLIQNQHKIPMTDEKTLRDIDKRMMKLINIKAERMALEVDYSELDKEMEQLVKYRRQNTMPTGVIKHFNTAEQIEYQRHYSAIKRVMDKAKKECPEAYYYVKAHLLTGVYLFWSSDPLKM